MAHVGERSASILSVQQWAARGHLWGILDATDAPAVLELVQSLGPERAVSLYRGRPEEDLAAIAPFLVQLDAATFQWLTEHLWAEPWGILLVATKTLEELRLHFRRFLIVESPDGEDWYFRFYDPRVLPKFLAASTETERTEFFGPISAFGVTDPESYEVRVLTPSPEPGYAPRPQTVVFRRPGSSAA